MLIPSYFVTIAESTPLNLIFTCENAWSYLQISVQACHSLPHQLLSLVNARMDSHGRPDGARQSPQGLRLTGLFARSILSTVGREGTWKHVRYPRLPENPPTELGPRAGKISGRYFHPPLHPKWSTSRVSLGSPARSPDRARLCCTPRGF